MPKFIIDNKHNSFKIYCNEILHIQIKKDELIGIQSWVGNKKYCIEFNLKNRDILAEYDKIDKWKDILKLIDDENII